jgi:hypothetical protein
MECVSALRREELMNKTQEEIKQRIIRPLEIRWEVSLTSIRNNLNVKNQTVSPTQTESSQ